MISKKNKKLFDTIETLVGKETVFTGDIVVSESLRVDGTLIGSIKEAANVIIGETAKVKGNIKASYVVVDGTVEGNIVATENIELLSKSKVVGDLTTSILSINEGAVFKGKSLMVEKEEITEENSEETI